MQLYGLLAVAAASLASAAPGTPGTFDVSKFTFGCTVGCDWNFDVKVTGSGPNHPAVPNAVHCAGQLDKNTDYVPCGKISDTQSISAYIVKDTNELKLKYDVSFPKKNTAFSFMGQQKVYAATSSQADLQKPAFQVKETSSTGVA